MTRILSVLVALVVLAGCANTPPPPRADVISFDRGQFGYTVGGAAQIIRTACKMGQLSKEDCAAFGEIEKNVVKQLTTPPAAPAATSSTVDMDAIARMLMTLGKLAL